MGYGFSVSKESVEIAMACVQHSAHMGRMSPILCEFKVTEGAMKEIKVFESFQVFSEVH